VFTKVGQERFQFCEFHIKKSCSLHEDNWYETSWKSEDLNISFAWRQKTPLKFGGKKLHLLHLLPHRSISNWWINDFRWNRHKQSRLRFDYYILNTKNWIVQVCSEPLSFSEHWHLSERVWEGVDIYFSRVFCGRRINLKSQLQCRTILVTLA